MDAEDTIEWLQTISIIDPIHLSRLPCQKWDCSTPGSQLEASKPVIPTAYHIGAFFRFKTHHGRKAHIPEFEFPFQRSICGGFQHLHIISSHLSSPFPSHPAFPGSERQSAIQHFSEHPQAIHYHTA